MRAVVQRVHRAKVTDLARNIVTGEIGVGMLVLLGVGRGDTPAEAEYLAGKIAGLRIFEDAEGKMNLGLEDVGGAILLVSQFTLYGDCRKGRRPSFIEAAPPELAKNLYEKCVESLRDRGIRVETGAFQTEMAVELLNAGPVTLVLDTEPRP